MVACDTHVHTFTYSGHGDATVDERMLTLAGEGIELPFCHRPQHADRLQRGPLGKWVCRSISPRSSAMKSPPRPGTSTSFLCKRQRAPDHHITDWPKLMRKLRATPGVRVVVLNHPRNVHSNFQPFADKNFNPVTGENWRGFEFSFNAMEAVNSSRSNPT